MRMLPSLVVAPATLLALACSSPRVEPDGGGAKGAAIAEAATGSDSVKAQLGDAWVRLTTGHEREAELTLRDLVSRWPQRADVHAMWLDACERTGNEEARLAELRRWLTVEPRCQEALHGLARCLTDPQTPAGLRDAREALDAARRACALASAPAPELLVTLGTTSYLSGDLDGAVAAYERALRASRSGQKPLDCEAELEALLRDLRAEMAR